MGDDGWMWARRKECKNQDGWLWNLNFNSSIPQALQFKGLRCFVPLSWENLRPSACRNILFILTSVVTLVRGGCLAAGAIFSAWGWEHLLARQLAPPFTPKASKWMLLGSWFYWGLCRVFCSVHVSMWCCFGSSISKQKKRQRILCAFASMEVENSNTIFSNLEEVKAMMMMMMMTAKFEEQSAQICALTIR